MAKREGGILATVKLFIPVDKKDTRSQIAVSQALLDAEEGKGIEGLLKIPNVSLMKVVDHRFTSREKPEAPAGGGEATGEAGSGQKDIEGAISEAGASETIEEQQARIRAEHEASEAAAEAEEAAGSAGEAQSDATEEAASGGTSRRSRRA